MDRLDNLAYTSISNYFQILSKLGYKSYKEVANLLTLILIEDLIRGEFSKFITEDDYRVIVRVLYCLFGSCMIPYPEIEVDQFIDLIADAPRITEYNIFRSSEHGDLRFTE